MKRKRQNLKIYRAFRVKRYQTAVEAYKFIKDQLRKYGKTKMFSPIYREMPKEFYDSDENLGGLTNAHLRAIYKSAQLDLLLGDGVTTNARQVLLQIQLGKGLKGIVDEKAIRRMRAENITKIMDNYLYWKKERKVIPHNIRFSLTYILKKEGSFDNYKKSGIHPATYCRTHLGRKTRV